MRNSPQPWVRVRLMIEFSWLDTLSFLGFPQIGVVLMLGSIPVSRHLLTDRVWNYESPT